MILNVSKMLARMDQMNIMVPWDNPLFADNWLKCKHGIMIKVENTPGLSGNIFLMSINHKILSK